MLRGRLDLRKYYRDYQYFRAGLILSAFRHFFHLSYWKASCMDVSWEWRHTAGCGKGSTWRCPDAWLHAEAVFADAAETEMAQSTTWRPDLKPLSGGGAIPEARKVFCNPRETLKPPPAPPVLGTWMTSDNYLDCPFASSPLIKSRMLRNHLSSS